MLLGRLATNKHQPFEPPPPPPLFSFFKLLAPRAMFSGQRSSFPKNCALPHVYFFFAWSTLSQIDLLTPSVNESRTQITTTDPVITHRRILPINLHPTGHLCVLRQMWNALYLSSYQRRSWSYAACTFTRLVNKCGNACLIGAHFINPGTQGFWGMTRYHSTGQ